MGGFAMGILAWGNNCYMHGHAKWVETRESDLTLGNFDSHLRIKLRPYSYYVCIGSQCSCNVFRPRAHKCDDLILPTLVKIEV